MLPTLLLMLPLGDAAAATAAVAFTAQSVPGKFLNSLCIELQAFPEILINYVCLALMRFLYS